MEQLNYFEKGNFFPPVEHEERLRRYEENKLLFEGKHKELVDRYQLNPRGKFYVSVNLAGLISKKSADFLIGDGITVSAGKKTNSNEQRALERLYQDNHLDVRLYESALGNSYRGDAFFKVRYGYEIEDLDEGLQIGERKTHIESIPAKYVYPESSIYDRKKHVAYHIAIPIKVKYGRDGKQMGDWQLELESHYPNRIVRKTKLLQVINQDYDGKPISWKIGPDAVAPTVEETGIPIPLVVHIPNYTTDDLSLGLDDLTELRPMFDELNNRFSQISNILDKHSDPAMAVPFGLMDVDENGRPIFKVSESKVFEVSDKDIVPQYITWNGQLQSAYSEIDRLTDEILTVAEVPEVALGKSSSGTSGSSGIAVRMRMNSLLSKVKRKRMYYDDGVKKLLLLAQMIEHEAGAEVDYEITVPKLVFSDGLPKDRSEETSIYLQKTGGAVLMSRKTALMELEGLTEEQAEAEIERIREEEVEARENEVESTGSGDVFNKLSSMYDNLNASETPSETQENEIEEENEEEET